MNIYNLLFIISALCFTGCSSSSEQIDSAHSWVRREAWEINSPVIPDVSPEQESFRHHGKA